MGWSKFESSIHVGDPNHLQPGESSSWGSSRAPTLVNFGESNFWRHNKVGIDYHMIDMFLSTNIHVS